MDAIKYYPVVDCNTEGTVKAPLFAAYNEDTVRQTQQVWLAEMVPNHYRLCCTDEGAERLNGSFSIRCPKCNHELRQIGRGIDNNKHGLYVCGSCRGE